MRKDLELFGKFLNWDEMQLHRVNPKNFVCGFCGDKVSSDMGYKIGEHGDGSGTIVGKGIFICPSCKAPTFFEPVYDNQHPGKKIGETITNLQDQNIATLYDEARNSFSVGAYTGVVLLSRKMLMNLSVVFGAEEGKSFVYYVNFLEDNHYIPKSTRTWVDSIRSQGNEATHKIDLKSEEEAQMILKFVEMLLKIHFEYPQYIVPPTDSE